MHFSAELVQHFIIAFSCFFRFLCFLISCSGCVQERARHDQAQAIPMLYMPPWRSRGTKLLAYEALGYQRTRPNASNIAVSAVSSTPSLEAEPRLQRCTCAHAATGPLMYRKLRGNVKRRCGDHQTIRDPTHGSCVCARHGA
jgi:hypothetical protein